MKKITVVLLVLLIFNCGNTQLKDRWISPEASDYTLQKVFVIGLTNNTEARDKFEKKLQNQLHARGIEASSSLAEFDTNFTSKLRTETELNTLEDVLLKDSYDAIIFTKVVGIKNKIMYTENYKDINTNQKRFEEDYLMYQDQFFNPDNYKEYQVYNAETSVYCICPTKERTLIWKGYIDIIDPETINQTVKDYSKLLILILEEDGIIPLLK